jgi:hypothetical protein
MDFRRSIALALVAAALLIPGSAAAYPWPIKPFNQPHPIRANFGDPRTVFFDQPPDSLDGPGLFSFHNGIDIAAPANTPVYPVEDGIAHYLAPTWLAVRTLRGSFRYIHIHPVVFEGQRVYRSRTILGYVEPWAGHLHFSELRGRVLNPLRRGHLTPYFDHTDPTVTELIMRTPDGHSFGRPFRVCGTVALSAIAQDSTSMPVPGTWAGLPVAPAIVSWTLKTRGGRTIIRPRVVVNFLQPLPPNASFWDVYARGTFQNSARFGRIQLSRLEGRFLFVLSRDWNTRRFANGDYVVTVTAQDARGNYGTLSEPITVANGSPGCPLSATGGAITPGGS